MNFLTKLFKFEENNTNFKTELLAGLTTFFTMSYLIILSPKILQTTGLDFNATLTITAILVFIFSVLMGLYTNKPYAVAPFLGETAFIAYTVVGTLEFSINTAFGAIFICGILLLLMSLFNIREFILNQIPETIKIAFCTGLGLFFMFIALKDMELVNFTNNAIPLSMGNFTDIHVILGLFCFITLIVLTKKEVKGAILIAIALTTIIGLLIGDITLPERLISIPTNISSSLLQIDFSNILTKNFLPIFFVIFLLVNIDTSGALIGLSYKTESNPKEIKLKKPMIVDSLSVIAAPLMGTTTPGAYFDSMTGIAAGGRTGLTAITVGILFLIGLIFAPIISIIPAYAYAPALLYIGILIATIITKLDFEDITEYATAFVIICTMIFTYNIGTGVVFGFIIYPLIKLLCGKQKQTNPTMWTLFALSIIYFIVYPY